MKVELKIDSVRRRTSGVVVEWKEDNAVAQRTLFYCWWLARVTQTRYFRFGLASFATSRFLTNVRANVHHARLFDNMRFK